MVDVGPERAVLARAGTRPPVRWLSGWQRGLLCTRSTEDSSVLGGSNRMRHLRSDGSLLRLGVVVLGGGIALGVASTVAVAVAVAVATALYDMVR